jgi:hypothetical protein
MVYVGDNGDISDVFTAHRARTLHRATLRRKGQWSNRFWGPLNKRAFLPENG